MKSPYEPGGRRLDSCKARQPSFAWLATPRSLKLFEVFAQVFQLPHASYGFRNSTRKYVGSLSPGGQASIVVACAKPGAVSSLITTAGGMPWPPRLAGTPSGNADPFLASS